jgi:alpha-1,6-mannosyltransferase
MKILDLCEFYSERGGGVRSYLTKLGTYAEEAGHELIVVAPGARDERVKEGGTIIERYSAPKMPYDGTYHVPLKLGRMRELIKKHAPDVLQVSSPFIPALVAGTLKQDVGQPGMVRVYVYHSDPIGCYLKPWAKGHIPEYFQRAALKPAWSWMRKVCSTHDKTVVAASWLRDELIEKGCPNVVNVDFGIEHQDFGPERRDERLRARFLGDLADKPEARLLVIAGRLAVDKRQKRLIEAIARLAVERPLALVVLGDGPERARLMKAAGDIPQAHFLKFTKDRAEYAAVLASADCLVHGSLCETYGFVLAETLASGTPFVAPDWGGARALAAPEYSESYPGLGDSDDVEAALRRLLNRPHAQLSRAAREAGLAQPHTRDHFSNLFSYYAKWLEERRNFH